jgi:3-oxoacyl-(acyl-carrier-protein) synthase
MTKQRSFYILGSGWLSALGYGTFGSKPLFSNEGLDFKYPDLEEYIHDLPARFGRFDAYTKVSFAAAVMALKDAGFLQKERKKNTGIIVGSSYGVYDNDMAYFESTREAQGEFTSPNLFSYTLPNVALGEIAVFFKFIGPTFCVGNDPDNPGLDVMPAALSLLESGQCDNILAGWVEVARNIQGNKEFPKGAMFAVLTLDKTAETKAGFSFNQSFRFSELVEG